MKRTHNSSRRLSWSGGLIVLLLLLAFKAGKEGISNFYAQSADMEVERWSQPGRRLRGDEGASALRYLERSLEYSPDNPWALEVLGTVQLRNMRASRDPQAAEAAARSANGSFRKALIERPTSPFAWASFALSKLYLSEQDEAMFQAIERAEELGPWEPGVQQAVIFAGLAVWDKLSPRQQSAVVRAMQNGARRNPLKIAEIAKSFNRIDLFCALSYIGTRGREVCSQTSQSGSKPNPKR